MKQVRYKHLPGIGPRTAAWADGPLDKFVVKLPTVWRHMRQKRGVPSMQDLNHLLRLGEDDAGMGGGAQWKPFTLTEAEYLELRESLLTDPNIDFDLKE